VDDIVMPDNNTKLSEGAIQPDHLIQRRWAKWALIVGLWNVFALIASAATYLGMRYGLYPGEPPISWWRAMGWAIASWYPLIILTPIILWLCRRFPLGRRHWSRTLLIHVPLSFVFVVINAAMAYSLLLPFVEARFMAGGLVQYYLRGLMGGLALNLIKYWAIVGVGYGLEYYRRYREREMEASRLGLKTSQLEAQLAHAQLQALKMQLHPHFLFNTLHAISALMDEDIKAARRMMARLSELLRLTLENTGQEKVSLRQELDVLERYLDIEQIRFQDRLVVRMAIAPETLDAQVPNLILQPIVENAIRHGVARASSAGRIEIHAMRDNGMLRLQVRDDGPGLPAGEPTTLKEGIGLTNTRARLTQLYGSHHRVDIDNASGGGCVVTLAIPYQQMPEKSVMVGS
jgi:sensor histidine kinase YesM